MPDVYQTEDGRFMVVNDLGTVQEISEQAAKTGKIDAAVVGAGTALGFPTEVGADVQKAQPGAFLAGQVVTAGAGFIGPAAGVIGRVMQHTARAQAQGAIQREGARRFTRDFGDMARGDNPGAIRGALGSAADQVQAGAQVVPGLRGFANLPAEARGREFNRLVVEAMGGTGDDLVNGTIPRTNMDQIVRRTQGKFNDAIDQTAQIKLGGETGRVIDLVKREKPLQAEVLGPSFSNLSRRGTVTGQQYQTIRQDLSKMLAKPSVDDDIKDIVQTIIEQMDEAAEGAGAVNTELYREARQEWRVWVAAQRGKSYSKENINPSSFINSLKNTYGNEFVLQRTGRQPEAVRNLLEGAAEIETLGTQIPSSGTAERLGGAALLGAGAAATGLLGDD